MTARVTAVVGNPKPGSRTLAAARLLAEALAGEPSGRPSGQPSSTSEVAVVDVITLGPDLLGWGGDGVAAAVAGVASSSVVVVASPTYKATYTGLLKLFLDRFSAGSLSGVVAVPLMLGAGPAHAMAPDLLLKPVLVELGATCPTPGLYLRDTTYDTGPELPDFAARWGPVVRAVAEAHGPA